jgi:hypothetical protein
MCKLVKGTTSNFKFVVIEVIGLVLQYGLEFDLTLSPRAAAERLIHSYRSYKTNFLPFLRGGSSVVCGKPECVKRLQDKRTIAVHFKGTSDKQKARDAGLGAEFIDSVATIRKLQ